MDLSDFQAEVRSAIGRALLASSSDYYEWSRGSSIQDSPVERIPQIYIARNLYDLLKDEDGSIVEVEYRTNNIFSDFDPPDEFRHGRVDVYAGVGANGPQALIEVKRFLNPGAIQGDVIRLAAIVERLKNKGRPTAGYVAATMYNKFGVNHDYSSHYDNNLSQIRIIFPNMRFRSYISKEEYVSQKNYNYKKSKVERHVSIVIGIES